MTSELSLLQRLRLPPSELPRTKLRYQISAEPVYDVAGRPRWTMEPDVTVRLEDATPSQGHDPILAAGIAALAGAHSG